MYSAPSKEEIRAIRGSGKTYSCLDEIYIRAPAEKIYQTLIDFNNRHQWWPNNLAKIEGPEELAEVDSTVTINSGKGLAKTTFRARVLHLDPPRRIVCHFFDGVIKGVVEWEIEEKNNGAGFGCLVRLSWGNVKPQTLLAKIAFKLTGTWLHRRRSKIGMEGLKKYLEEELQ
jgi:uncharacterized protein YndB with AHSA1/START domain